MQEIEKDFFYDFVKKYGSDGEDHWLGETYYYLLRDEKPYEGLRSHREALEFVFDLLIKRSREDQEKAGQRLDNDMADRPDPWTYDIMKAQAVRLDPREFFFCPDIVRTDFYGNVWYDAGWKPDDENIGTSVPYWYAVMEPVHGRKNKPEDFKKANEILFPKGTDTLDIYEWTTDWSDYFDDGHEWYGACCWSIFDKNMDRYAVMLVSATD